MTVRKPNGPKLNQAAAATNAVLKHWHEAQDALKTCYTNGSGILSSPTEARSALATAKEAIEKAQAVIRAADWPTDEDYGD